MSSSADSNSGDEGQTAVVAVIGVILALAITTVALRFYVRRLTKAGIWWDDWLILAALITALATVILLVWVGTADANGPSVSENTDPNYVYTPEDVLFEQLTFICSLLYFSIVSWTKLGILLMYNRIFNVDNVFRWQLAVAGFLVGGWWIGCTVAGLTNCIPLYLAWLSNVSDPRYCFNSNVFWLASGVCEVLMDIVILALPVRVVAAMQLSTRKKATVACIFLLGGFVIITGLVKVIISYAPGQREPNYSNGEVWAVVHVGMAIICASLPIFKPLVSRISESTLITSLRTFFPHYRFFGSSGWSLGHQGWRGRLDEFPEEVARYSSEAGPAGHDRMPVMEESKNQGTEAAFTQMAIIQAA